MASSIVVQRHGEPPLPFPTPRIFYKIAVCYFYAPGPYLVLIRYDVYFNIVIIILVTLMHRPILLHAIIVWGRNMKS